MSREESKMMQGVAILIMIFFHLFNPHDSTQYTGSVLGRIATGHNPVPFFVLLSGYGLYKLNTRNGGRTSFSRCYKLYLRYWYVLSFFLFFSYCLGNHRYDLSPTTFISNYLGLISTYYLPSWFILPYCMLVVLYPYIFRILDKLPPIQSLILAYAIYLFSASLTRLPLFQGNIFQVFYILFPFCLGALMAKTNFVEKTYKWLNQYPVFLSWGILFSAVIIRYFFISGAFQSFYAATVITSFVAILRRQKMCNTILTYLGKASFYMWMIHAWICWYLFREEVYSLRNPLLIYLSVVITSYILSVAFSKLYKMVSKAI